MSNPMNTSMHVTPETLLNRAQDMLENQEVSEINQAIFLVVTEWHDESNASAEASSAMFDQVKELYYATRQNPNS